MKTHIGFSILQVVVLAVVVVLLVQIGNRMDQLNARIDSVTNNGGFTPQGEGDLASQAPGSLDENLLRKIVRTEIHAELQEQKYSSGSTAQQNSGLDAIVQFGNATGRVNDAEQDLADFIELGQISDTELSDLQQKIASLEPQRRVELLQALSDALNSGQLETHF